MIAAVKATVRGTLRKLNAIAAGILAVCGVSKLIPVREIPPPNKEIGVTDGKTIYVGLNSDVFDPMTEQEKAAGRVAVMVHELGHVLFTDFTVQRELSRQIICNDLNSLRMDRSEDWYEEGWVILETFCDGLSNVSMQFFASFFLQFQNSFEDAFIESCVKRIIGGKYAKALAWFRAYMHRRDATITEMVEQESKRKLPRFVTMRRIWHQYVTTGSVKAESVDNLKEPAYLEASRVLSEVEYAATEVDRLLRFQYAFAILVYFAEQVIDIVREQTKMVEEASETTHSTLAATPGLASALARKKMPKPSPKPPTPPPIKPASSKKPSEDETEEELSPDSADAASEGSEGEETEESSSTATGSAAIASEETEESSSTAKAEPEEKEDDEGEDKKEDKASETSSPTESEEDEPEDEEETSGGEATSGEAGEGEEESGESRMPISMKSIALPKEGTGGIVKEEIDPECPPDATEILSDMLSEGEEEGTEQTDRGVLDELRSFNKTVPYGDIHKGVSIIVKRINPVSCEHKDAYRNIKPKIDAIVRRSTKGVEKAIQVRRQGGRKSGLLMGKKVDVKRTYRNDGRIFANSKLPQTELDIAFAVLIDESGSMGGPRIEEAKLLALVLHGIARKLKIPCGIYGHTEHDSVEIFAYADFASASEEDAARIMDVQARANNRDGAALAFVVERLAQRTEKTKIIFSISDGQPAAIDYGGEDARNDLRGIKNYARKKGIRILVAAIGSDKDRIQEIYDDSFMDVSNLSELPNILSKKLLESIKL